MGSVITLLTDFGTGSYVAQMKGVILRLARQAILVDITHQIPPGDIDQAAWILLDTYRAFPVGTIHLVVVDPGVGSQRKLISIRVRGMIFLAPDNGVLSHVISDAGSAGGIACLEIRQSKSEQIATSSVFHGRDFLAPMAARLATGVPWESCGVPVSGLVTLPGEPPQRDGSMIHGRIVYIDRFGNCVTNILSEDLEQMKSTSDVSQLCVHVGGHCLLGLKTHYAEVEDGQSLFLVGSCGRLEIAVRNGNAAETLGLHKNSVVELHWQ